MTNHLRYQAANAAAEAYRLRDHLEDAGRPVAELDAVTTAAAELDYVAEGLRIAAVTA